MDTERESKLERTCRSGMGWSQYREVPSHGPDRQSVDGLGRGLLRLGEEE